jgi:hypothetical protein
LAASALSSTALEPVYLPAFPLEKAPGLQEIRSMEWGWFEKKVPGKI